MTTTADVWAGTEANDERLRLLAIVWDSRPHECVWCGQGTARGHATAHHLIPRGWVGSSDRPSNLAIVHLDRCHDEIEQWTADHGRQPKPDELHDQRHYGFIREPAVRYTPRLDDVMGGTGPLTTLLEGLNTTDGPPADGPVVVRMSWSPVAYILADRLTRPGYLFAIADPVPGETAETFYRRNGLRGIALPEAPTTGPHLARDNDPASRSGQESDLAGAGIPHVAEAPPARSEAPVRTQEASPACPGCGGPLPLGRRGQDRLTCSDRCRQAVGRRRAVRGARADGNGADADVTASRAAEADPFPVPTARAAASAHRLLAPARDVRPEPVSEGPTGEIPNLGLF